MIYWLGGGSCGGKSTIADKLGAELGWEVYHVDAWYEEHKARVTAVAQPTIYRLSRLSGDDLWMRPVAEQVRTALAFATEAFEFIAEDVLNTNHERDLLVEGFPLLPHLVTPHLSQPNHAFWLIPQPDFQRTQYAQRPWIHDVLIGTSAPDRAFANWMARDAGLAQALQKQVEQLGLNWLLVDGSLSIADTAVFVAKALTE